jgi:hypothetical protein
MGRTQAGDVRERSAVSSVLVECYRVVESVRHDFLSAIESRLVDLRVGHITPFAGAPLLTVLAQAMDVDLSARVESFRRVIVNSVLPLFVYRYLPVAAIVPVFLKFLGTCQQFGLVILSVLQRNWPLSTRAASCARVGIAVFCAIDHGITVAHASQFFDFLAAAVSSIDSGLTAAVLGIFEHPPGIELVRKNVVDAILKLYGPLAAVRDRHWHFKLREKAAAALEILAGFDQRLFGHVAGLQPEHGSWHVPTSAVKWQAIADMVTDGDVPIAHKPFMEQLDGACGAEVHTMPKIVHTTCDFGQHHRRPGQAGTMRRRSNIASGPHLTIPHRSMSGVRLVTPLRTPPAATASTALVNGLAT